MRKSAFISHLVPLSKALYHACFICGQRCKWWSSRPKLTLSVISDAKTYHVHFTFTCTVDRFPWSFSSLRDHSFYFLSPQEGASNTINQTPLLQEAVKNCDWCQSQWYFTLQGDSGGVLLCENYDGEWVPTGIVSWGVICGNENLPGAYTYIPAYLDWIYQTLASDS